MRPRTKHRRTGRTTQDISAALKGAVFIIHDAGFKPYARDLARTLGRHDLEILSVEEAYHRVIGTDLAIHFDHFVFDCENKSRTYRDALDQLIRYSQINRSRRNVD